MITNNSECKTECKTVCSKREMKYIEPSPLKISTYTMVMNIGNKVNLHIFSRLLPIYKENCNLSKSVDGCFLAISNYTDGCYTDLPRGKIANKLPTNVFNKLQFSL